MNAIQLYMRVQGYPYDLSDIRPLDGQNAEDVVTAYLDACKSLRETHWSPTTAWGEVTYIYGENDDTVFELPHMLYMWGVNKAAVVVKAYNSIPTDFSNEVTNLIGPLAT